MQTLPKLFHYLRMRKPFFPCRSLGLSNSEFFKELHPCLESFIMLNAHNNKIAFTILSQINRLVFLMAQGRYVSRPVAQAGNGFYDWYRCFLKKFSLLFAFYPKT